MGKGREFKRKAATESVPREHPAGGTFFIRILSLRQLTELQDLMSVPVLVKDEKGQVVYNRRGDPGMRYRQDIGALLHFLAWEVVEKIEDVFDEDGAPIQWTPELIEQFLDTIPDKKDEAVVGWLIDQAVTLGTDNAKAEAKN